MAELAKRFLAPPGWLTQRFTNNETGHDIHYGFAFPQTGKPPAAIVVCLGGLSEFTEKYFEIGNELLARNCAFWSMDWFYQGRSGRMKQHPQRRHCDGFDCDISDLKKFMDDCVLPATTTLGGKKIPVVLLAHSMGAHLGLRFLSKYPDYFTAAAFSAPLMAIHNFGWPMKFLARILTPFMPQIGTSYVFGGSDWKESMRRSDGTDKFSSDKIRDTIHNHWSKSDPALQVGNPTFLWVVEALKSMAELLKPGTLENIKIPVLIAVGDNDTIVDSTVTKIAAKRVPAGQLLEISGAHHEIFMETDEYRGAFFKAFDKMLERNNISITHNEGLTMQGFTKNKDRLSDRIMFALELALEQKDLETSEALNSALELSMTRNSGGGEFVERRDYPKDVEKMLAELRALKGKA